ncbi:sugar ABC transporter substrate-binding protein [Rhizobium sp. TH2]|uniref:sugar ABC transporter substrate-binding protein n=1 Tax=Rhizobium sp. TH2 TaxID=2775403 RepID=UPI0021575BF9|nr:sugar ABC transporter substrate-binding protein [Rhizobium sp. TH2]UVC09224.1 sugar ABC transporter substrate-binding protein [Rhizobium sp. TH2]
MKDRQDFLHSGEINRRTLMLGTAAGLAVAAMPKGLLAADKPTLVTSIRSLSNPYHAVWKQGAEAFAAAAGLEHVTLVSEGNSEKGIADIKAMLAKTGGNMVLNSDPNDTPDARPIVEACAKAGAYVVTQWNKPADLHPKDFNPNYISHIEFDGIASGKQIAEILFKSIGGSGGIIALGGMISTTAAIERKKGLDEALAANPNIKLLDFQVANWKSTEAFDLTSNLLTRFGDEIKGIWAANDDMGTGALEALRAEDLAGKVPVVGIDGIKTAVDAVRSGEFACTITSDPFWQGGMGLSIGLNALMKKFDPATEPPEHREFYGKVVLIEKANVEEYYKTNIDSKPTMDWNDIWGRVVGPIRV